MNRNDFINMMSEANPLNRQSIGEIYELVDIFPYFQSAHLLLLKGLHGNGDVKFENQLRNSAIHVADREVLYYLLKNKTDSVKSPEPLAGEKFTETEPFSDTQQTVIESAKNSMELINEIEKSSGEDIQIDEKGTYDSFNEHSILINSEFETDERAGIMMLENEESEPVEEEVFFMDPGFSMPEKEDLLELDLDENTSYGADDKAVETDILQKEEDITVKQIQSDLIDKFIIANPRIEPNRDRTITPVEDISKPFVEEEGGFVTETLARIYVSQGYYSKAIDIYEKLSLKFPEKSSYFASQIEKVKEYIKK